MSNKDYLEFVKSRARTTKRRDSNCMGTAFYLAGEQEKDIALNRKKSLEMLSDLEDSTKPENGHLVYWRNNGYLLHAGIVFDKENLTMVHRREKSGLLEMGSISDLSEHFGAPKYKIPKNFNN